MTPNGAQIGAATLGIRATVTEPLPAPNGSFFMVLREYWPKPEALNGSWKVPPAVRASQ